MEYFRIEDKQYDKLLEKDPKLIQADIIDFISYLIDKKCSSASISVYVSGLRKFYYINDIVLNWKKIREFEPDKESVAEDRPYTHSEIKMLVDRTGLRNKAIMLLMSSSGSRVGAIPFVRMKDLEPIDKYNIYKVTYYPSFKKHRYFSFTTPECRKTIDDYISHRKNWGERIKDDSPLFRTISNKEDLGYKKVSPIGLTSIQAFVMTLARDCGLRDIRIIEGMD